MRFHLRAFARTTQTAHLLAATLAESAFEEGSYRLFDYDMGDPFFAKAVNASQELKVEPFPAHERLFTDEWSGLYDDFSRLGHVAPVEELCGAFRLPVASIGSPSCIRKNTDPKPATGEDMILLGYDVDPIDRRGNGECKGAQRGILVNHLTKHGFVTGVPGSGKTTALMNLLSEIYQK